MPNQSQRPGPLDDDDFESIDLGAGDEDLDQDLQDGLDDYENDDDYEDDDFDEDDLDVCPLCAAYVDDVDRHSRWHNALDHALGDVDLS